MGIIVESIIQNALTYRCISPYSVFYFTTSVQMKHFQYVIHKPECSIQTQVVILKVLMIITSAVTEPRWRDKNRSHSSTHLLKGAVITLFFQHFHYAHLTTCVRLEEIVNHQYPHFYHPCFKSVYCFYNKLTWLQVTYIHLYFNL